MTRFSFTAEARVEQVERVYKPFDAVKEVLLSLENALFSLLFHAPERIYTREQMLNFAWLAARAGQ